MAKAESELKINKDGNKYQTAESERDFKKSETATKKVRYNGTDSITSIGRSQSDKDDARRIAKEKVKNPETNESLKSGEAYVKSVGIPKISHHNYVKSNASLQTEIAELYPKLIGVDSPNYKETHLEKNIYKGYKAKFPTIIKDYKIKNYKDLVEKSYAQLIYEIDKQYYQLPIHITYHDGDNNYENSADMMDDVHNFGHLWVFKGGDDHPKLGSITKDKNDLTANEKFRAVHDYYGHSVEGYQFGKDGEENAWIEHSKMLSPLAQWALSTETRGQNSWVNYSGINKDVLETIAIGSKLKKQGLADGNSKMIEEGQSLLDTVYDVFVFAEQKSIILPVEYTDNSMLGGNTLKNVPEKLDISNRYENGGLIAPNGKPTNLTPEQYRLVRTTKFKEWFGDWENDPENSSKVVDENGEPMVVYHGSRYGGINIFDITQSKRVSSGLREYGHFFTTNKLAAELYRNSGRYTDDSDKERIKEIYKLENLLETTKNNRDYYKIQTEIDKWYSKTYEVFLNLRKVKEFDAKFGTNKEGYWNLEVDAGYKIANGNDAIEFLKEGRFGIEKVDGIIAHNVVEIAQKTADWEDYIGTSYLVFEPQNIKLADGSNTTFDINNPDIRYERGGELNKPKNINMLHRKHLSLNQIENIDLADKIIIKESLFELSPNGHHYSGDRYITGKIISPLNNISDSYLIEVEECHCHKPSQEILKGTVINRTRKHLYLNGKLVSKAEMGTTLATFEHGGINPDSKDVKDYFSHNSGEAGGLLIGNRHSEGGIKAEVHSTGQNIEMEGGEAVITRGAVASNKKYEYEGKQMTTREILSDLNVKGGGVSFAEGGDIPEKIKCACNSFNVGGIPYSVNDFVRLSEKDYETQRLIDGIEKERKDHFYTLAKLNAGAITIEQALKEIAVKEMMIDPKYPY